MDKASYKNELAKRVAIAYSRRGELSPRALRTALNMFRVLIRLEDGLDLLKLSHRWYLNYLRIMRIADRGTIYETCRNNAASDNPRP